MQKREYNLVGWTVRTVPYLKDKTQKEFP